MSWNELISQMMRPKSKEPEGDLRETQVSWQQHQQHPPDAETTNILLALCTALGHAFGLIVERFTRINQMERDIKLLSLRLTRMEMVCSSRRLGSPELQPMSPSPVQPIFPEQPRSFESPWAGLRPGHTGPAVPEP